MEELGTHSTIERVELVTLLLQCYAPSFYPDPRCFARVHVHWFREFSSRLSLAEQLGQATLPNLKICSVEWFLSRLNFFTATAVGGIMFFK